MDDLLRRMDSGRVLLIADETRHVDLIQRAHQALPKDRLTIRPRFWTWQPFICWRALWLRVDLAGSLATTSVDGHQRSVHQSRVAHDRSPQHRQRSPTKLIGLCSLTRSCFTRCHQPWASILRQPDSTHRDPAGSSDHRTGNTRSGQISNPPVNQVSNASPSQVGYGPVDQISIAPVEQKSDQFADDTQSTIAMRFTWLPVVDLSEAVPLHCHPAI